MMGQRDFETKLYYQLSLDRLVPADHLLRRILTAVDFSFVRRLCRPYYSHSRPGGDLQDAAHRLPLRHHL